MRKSKLFITSLFIAGALISCSKSPMEKITNLISPSGTSTFLTENNGGNVTCEEVALATGCYFENTSGKIDYNGGNGGTYGPITWTTDGTYVNWSSTIPVKIAIIVKGGNNANVYSSGCDAECITSGTALSAPLNPNTGRPYGLSNITFCFTECEQTPQLVIALKVWMTGWTWAVTGGGPDNNYYIGYYPFVPNVEYNLYKFGGETIVGNLVIGNFDADSFMEVKITSPSSEGLEFIYQPYLYVGTVEDFNINYDSYPYPLVRDAIDPPLSEVILDLPF